MQVFQDHSVLLRLKAGSQEAGFLTALFPIPKNPTLVVLRNGKLEEYIAAGTRKEDFSKRVRTALRGPEAAAAESAAVDSPEAPVPAPSAVELSAESTSAHQEPTPSSSSPPVNIEQPPTARAPEASDSATQPPSSHTSLSNTDQRTDAIRSVLAERAERLAKQREEAKKKALEAYARAKKAKGKDKAKDDDGDGDSQDQKKSPPPTTAQTSHAEAIRKKQKESQEERRRILKQIEDDKADRRERALERERLRKGLTSGDVAASLVNAPSSGVKRSGGMVSLQVRLFDGSSMRSRFPEGASLAKDVRGWIDADRQDGGAAGAPYKFKVVLTPLPNKTIEETDEEKSLGELGLGPSSTMILVPVPRYSSAYAGPGSGSASENKGVVGSVVGFFIWFVGMIVSFFTSLFSTAPAPRREEQQQQPAAADAEQRDGQEGLRRRRGREETREGQRDYQLYNGNSVSFFRPIFRRLELAKESTDLLTFIYS